MNQDYYWLEKNTLPAAFKKAAADKKGLGRLPMPADLAEAVADAKKALPLGFARLVILTTDGTVRFVSAMLPMWHGEQRFAFTRYIWSLRNLPAEGVDAYWIIYTIKGDKLFDELVKEAPQPQRSCEEIFGAALKAQAAAPAPKPEQSPGLMLVAACASVKGKPRVVRSVTTNKTKWSSVEKEAEKKAKKMAEKKTGTDDEAENSDMDAANTLSGKSSVAVALPLHLDAGPGDRPGGWGFLDSRKHLSMEVVVPPGTKAKDVAARAMGDNKTEYFKGTGGAGSAAPPKP